METSHAADAGAALLLLARIAGFSLLGIEDLLRMRTCAGGLVRRQLALVGLVEQREGAVGLVDEFGALDFAVAIGVVVAELDRLEHAVGGDDLRVLGAVE